MSRYRRFIAYVYEYVDGKKGNGKGFIKVEEKDGICRMQYKLSGVCKNTPVPGKIYGYVRKNNICEGIALGECDLSGENIQFECEMPADRMGESPYTLEDICGLIILADIGIMYGSGWDDRPIQLQEILLPEEKKRPMTEDEIQESLILQEEQETHQTEHTEIQEHMKEDQNPEENQNLEDTSIVQENQEEKHESSIEEPIQKKEAGEVTDCEAEEKSIEFCDNAFCGCRKITPSDFQMLSRKDQGLLYNNFLRHGFSKYGFVMIARREEDHQYILGVPGTYERQEALMANMFGFPYFKEIGGCQNGKERLGYWYRFIDQPNL